MIDHVDHLNASLWDHLAGQLDGCLFQGQPPRAGGMEHYIIILYTGDQMCTALNRFMTSVTNSSILNILNHPF